MLWDSVVHLPKELATATAWAKALNLPMAQHIYASMDDIPSDNIDHHVCIAMHHMGVSLADRRMAGNEAASLELARLVKASWPCK